MTDKIELKQACSHKVRMADCSFCVQAAKDETEANGQLSKILEPYKAKIVELEKTIESGEFLLKCVNQELKILRKSWSKLYARSNRSMAELEEALKVATCDYNVWRKKATELEGLILTPEEVEKILLYCQRECDICDAVDAHNCCDYLRECRTYALKTKLKAQAAYKKAQED
jgi:hypothetical protein